MFSVCINLDRRPERWAKFQADNAHLLPHLTINRLSAVDRNDVGSPPSPRGPYTAYASLLSHIKALEAGLSSGAEHTLIFEDDCITSVHFPAQLSQLYRSLPSSDTIFFATNPYDVLLLGGYDYDSPAPTWDKNSSSTSFAFIPRARADSICYMVHRSYLPTLIRHAKSLAETREVWWDWILGTLAPKTNAAVYGHLIPIAYQSIGLSDNANNPGSQMPWNRQTLDNSVVQGPYALWELAGLRDVLHFLQSRSTAPLTTLELGGLDGCSTLLIASQVCPLGGSHSCISLWPNNHGHNSEERFGWNLWRYGFREAVRSYNTSSHNANLCATFPDQSLDFLHIDASHTYEDVLLDLQMWVPKVKPGGVIALHDYEPVPYWDPHPGVSQACNAYFKCPPSHIVGSTAFFQPPPTA